MKTVLFSFLLLATAALGAFSAHAESFAYLGTLNDSGKPANGIYDFRLTLYADAARTKPIAAPVVLQRLAVHGGSFSANVDFGTKADVTLTSYLGEQVRASAGGSDFSEPGSDSTIPMAISMASQLVFDGRRSLVDVVASIVDCSPGGGMCTCVMDQYSNCDLIGLTCLRLGGHYTGNSQHGVCYFYSH